MGNLFGNKKVYTFEPIDGELDPDLMGQAQKALTENIDALNAGKIVWLDGRVETPGQFVERGKPLPRGKISRTKPPRYEQESGVVETTTTGIFESLNAVGFLGLMLLLCIGVPALVYFLSWLLVGPTIMHQWGLIVGG